jgi:hypothetical protein
MPKTPIPKTSTLEASSYLDGLFAEFREEINRYKELTSHMMQLEARLELTEKRLSLTRDHLEMAITTSEGCQKRLPEFKQIAASVQFVGLRLVDACTAILREHHRLTPEKLLDAINEGTFRFRTNSPLREIHAALLRQPNVERKGQMYVWTGPREKVLKGSLASQAPDTSAEGKPN